MSWLAALLRRALAVRLDSPQRQERRSLAGDDFKEVSYYHRRLTPWAGALSNVQRRTTPRFRGRGLTPRTVANTLGVLVLHFQATEVDRWFSGRTGCAQQVAVMGPVESRFFPPHAFFFFFLRRQLAMGRTPK